jgi:hypothetical protein
VKAHAGVASDDWNEAGLLATSAVEHALAKINSTSNWRSLYTNNTPIADIAAGRGTFAWKFVDEIDGILANDPTQKVRLYGIGRVGGAMRMFSVQLPGSNSVDVFKMAVASCTDISCDNHLTLNGGPLYTRGTYTSGSATTGDVEAEFVVNGSKISGTTTTPPPARTMPSAGVYDLYAGLATDIPFNNLPMASINRKLLSAASNPFGTGTNAQGIYKLSIPSNTTVTITASRLVATLVVTLGSNSRLNVTSRNLWQSPGNNYPILIVKGDASGSVAISGSTNNLTEAWAGTNFNPAGTPYQGHSDSDMTDSYPDLLSGFIHIIGNVSTTITSGNIDHTIFSEGPISFTGTTTVTVDPTLYSNPPMGYCAPNQCIPIDGSWRWEVLP